MSNLELSLSGFLTAPDPDQKTLLMLGELLDISTLDSLLPTLLIATLCLCVLSVLTYHSLVLAWEIFWASRQSSSLLDPSTEVVLTVTVGRVVTTLFTPSTDVLLLWIVLATSCSSSLFYVTNLLYNFSNLGYNKLCS